MSGHFDVALGEILIVNQLHFVVLQIAVNVVFAGRLALLLLLIVLVRV